MIRQLWKCEDGLTTVEYAMMMMLVVVASASAWATLGTGTANSAQLSSEALPH